MGRNLWTGHGSIFDTIPACGRHTDRNAIANTAHSIVACCKNHNDTDMSKITRHSCLPVCLAVVQIQAELE